MKSAKRPKFTVRMERFTPALWQQVVAIDRLCFGSACDAPAEGKLWIARDRERNIVGYTIARVSDTLFVSRQGVLEGSRGNGLQKRMLRAVVAYGHRNGLATVSYTHTASTISANNFIRCGFRVIAVPDLTDGWICWRHE